VNRAACTIVAKNRISLARVLARSFAAYHPSTPFFVVLADEVDGWFDPAGEPFALIRLADLDIPAPARFRFGYAQQPLSYAVTPYALTHLIARGFEAVLFFKQESLVLGDHEAVFAALERHPIVLTPHLLAPLSGPDRIARELNILQSGIFNVGLLGVARHDASARFLAWWQDRLVAHCRHAVAEGMHFEQRWLDLVPGYFADAHVLRDPAFNVAHWNLPERGGVLDRAGHRSACRLIRFSGYDPGDPCVPTQYTRRLTWETIGRARDIFDRYRRALMADGWEETRDWPYAYGAFDNGIPVPDCTRHVYLGLGPTAEAFGDPLVTAPATSFFRWLQEPARDTEPPASAISRLWHTIYTWRPDVQRAYPDIFAADRDGFLAWVRASGVHEHGIRDGLVARTAGV
jgi:hypothetical protein